MSPTCSQLRAQSSQTSAHSAQVCLWCSVPSSMKDTIVQVSREIPVVVTTRCANGPTLAPDVYPNKWDELIDSGVHFENHLDRYKARTRLILSIATGRE